MAANRDPLFLKPGTLFKPIKDGPNPAADIKRGAAEPIRARRQKYGMDQNTPADSVLKNKPVSPTKSPSAANTDSKDKINRGKPLKGKATNPY